MKTEALKPLIQNIQEIDFDKDIDQVFSCLTTYLNITKQLNTTSQEFTNGNGPRSIFDQPVKGYRAPEGTYKNPKKLISRFEDIYAKPVTRFDIACWKSAIASAKLNTEVEEREYCLPVLEFLSKNTLLKSDVLEEICRSFPFVELFQSHEWPENKKERGDYAYIEHLLIRGNFELDAAVDSLQTHRYDRRQLDDILGSLLQSSFLVRKKDYGNAFKVLVRIPNGIKPLIVWQRILNILYRAAVIEKQEEPRDLFVLMLNECLLHFPGDGHILYLRSAFAFETGSAEDAKRELIKTLKNNPLNLKCFYLLGKCYLKLNSFENAHIIFKKLIELNPKNMEYAAYAAAAIDGLREQQAKADMLERDLSYYKNRITQLLDLHIYDEINVPVKYEDEPDLKALMLYAKASELHYYGGKTETEYLHEALAYAQDRDVVLRVVRKLFDFHPNFEDMPKIKNLIFKYLEEFPEDYATNFAAAGYCFSQGDYEKSLAYYEKAKNLNPQNIYAYLGVARAAEKLEKYQKAVDAIRFFVHEQRYDARGYDMMGCCQFNMGNYYAAYECFHWLVQIRKPKPSAKDQYLLLSSLSNYVSKLEENEVKTPHIQNEISEAITLFDSLDKDDQFRKNANGRLAYYRAAKLCEYVEWNDKGLEYIEEAIKIWTCEGNKNLGELAELKTRFLIAKGRYDGIADFLSPYIAYLESSEADPFHLNTCYYYMVMAFKNLGMDEENYRWELKMITHYASIDNCDLNWLKKNFFNLFKKCVIVKKNSWIKETGLKYFDLIPEVIPEHIVVAYWMGKIYQEDGNPEKSQKYFRDSVRYGQGFPGEFNDLAEASGKSLIS